MSFPTEFSLKEIDDIYYLCALPIREIEGLSKRYTQVAGRTLCAGRPERILLEQAPYWIKMQLAPSPSAKLTVKVFGIELELDRQENSIRLGDKTAPITLTGTEWDLVLLVDRCSVELYLDGGKIYLGTADESTYCDYNLPYMELSTTADCTLRSAELTALRSIWEV